GSDWLKIMVAQLLQPGVGAVGAKLTWHNQMVQHGGVVMGINGLVSHAGNGLHQHDAGYLGLNQVARAQSAVTAACLLTHKKSYMRAGGLDEARFPVAFNDVDLCLRLREAGENVVWVPFAQLIHAESASRGKEDTASKIARSHREKQQFLQIWMQSEHHDPYY